MNMNEIAPNFDQPIRDVYHGQLTPFDYRSRFKRDCPVCERGVLLMQRNNQGGELLELDRCVSCGQQFRYLDIEELRKGERP